VKSVPSTVTDISDVLSA